MLIGQDRGNFLLMFARRRVKLLLNDWHASCQATTCKRNCRKMVSRFKKVDDEFIKELKEMSENENTKKRTEYWKKRFQKVGD